MVNINVKERKIPEDVAHLVKDYLPFKQIQSK